MDSPQFRAGNPQGIARCKRPPVSQHCVLRSFPTHSSNTAGMGPWLESQVWCSESNTVSPMCCTTHLLPLHNSSSLPFLGQFTYTDYHQCNHWNSCQSGIRKQQPACSSISSLMRPSIGFRNCIFRAHSAASAILPEAGATPDLRAASHILPHSSPLPPAGSVLCHQAVVALLDASAGWKRATSIHKDYASCR